MESEEVAGVALVRVWASADTPDRLVVRIVAIDRGTHRPIGVASTITGATALLQGWLEELIRGQAASRDRRSS